MKLKTQLTKANKKINLLILNHLTLYLTFGFWH